MTVYLQHINHRLTAGAFFLALGIGIITGLLIVGVQPLYLLVSVAAVVVLANVAVRPEWGILTIVVIIASIVFVDELPLIPIGIGSLHITDLLIIVMLATICYKKRHGRQYILYASCLNLPLALFICSAILSAAIPICLYNQNFNDTIRVFRYIAYYLLFYIVNNNMCYKNQIQFLVKGLFAISAMVSIVMIIQAMVGDSIQLMPGRIENAMGIENEFNTLRIIPPGETLVFVSLILAFGFLSLARKKSFFRSPYLYLTMILSIGVILTYNRSFWIPALLAMITLFLLAPSKNKVKLMATMVLVTGLLALAVFTLNPSGGKLYDTFEAVAVRFTSLFAGKEMTQSGSLEFRYMENQYAISQIVSHPLIGIGLGTAYRPSLSAADDTLTSYVHNGYLWLILDIGLIGFSLFIWYYAGFILRGLRRWKQMQDEYLRVLTIGCVISGIGLMLMAPVNPVFMQWFSIVVIAIIIGLSEASIRIDEGEQKQNA